ncbi:MFS transporter [Streptomyces sp. TLI_171]|uniref:MFS transporter n=1 Tax=Streptomyces sp. TLI_171 TaxID=1938859 RepID=UPI000C173BEB|nr:MFS transporter [Streptomyces sp. TLI_171]RKE20424.1 putative MFS family arabinose efflux permease [Streptomyces sp. TLI_171]
MTTTAAEPASASRLALARMGQALQGRDFRIWFAGQLMSASGALAQGVVLSWMIYQLTHNAVWLTLLTACTWGPTLVLGPWAGALVDRSERRRLLMVTQALMLSLGLALAVTTALFGQHLWLLLTLATCTGLVATVDSPARQVFVVDLVGAGSVASAVGLWEVALNASRVIGPSVAGALLSFGGPAPAFAFNALTYCAPLLALSKLRPAAPVDRTAAALRQRASAREGLAYARRSPIIRGLLPMSAASGLIFAMNLTVPPLVDRALHLGPTGYSLLMAAFGLGGLPGALLAASAPEPTPRRVRTLSVATSVAVLATALAPDVYVAVPGMAAVGLTSIWYIASANTLAQLRSAPEMRGRVMSLWGSAMTGTLPLTGLAVTFLAQNVGARLGFAVSGAALLLATLAAWRALRPAV